MTSRFDIIARFDIVRSDSCSLEPGAAGCFESPHLRLALGILDLQVEPRMRHNQVHFLDHALDVHECVFIVAVRMVRPCRHSKRSCTNQRNTDT